MNTAAKIEVLEFCETEETILKDVSLSNPVKAPTPLAMDNGSYHRDAISRLENEFFPTVATFENTYPKLEFGPLVDLAMSVATRLTKHATAVTTR